MSSTRSFASARASAPSKPAAFIVSSVNSKRGPKVIPARSAPIRGASATVASTSVPKPVRMSVLPMPTATKPCTKPATATVGPRCPAPRPSVQRKPSTLPTRSAPTTPSAKAPATATKSAVVKKSTVTAPVAKRATVLRALPAVSLATKASFSKSNTVAQVKATKRVVIAPVQTSSKVDTEEQTSSTSSTSTAPSTPEVERRGQSIARITIPATPATSASESRTPSPTSSCSSASSTSTLATPEPSVYYEMVNTVFGPRRIAVKQICAPRIVVPAYDPNSLASKNKNIQFELEVLRSQAKVGGKTPLGSGEGVNMSLRALGIIERVKKEKENMSSVN